MDEESGQPTDRRCRGVCEVRYARRREVRLLGALFLRLVGRQGPGMPESIDRDVFHKGEVRLASLSVWGRARPRQASAVLLGGVLASGREASTMTR